MIQHQNFRDVKVPRFCGSPFPAFASPPFLPLLVPAEDHGIPERVMLSYLQGEIEGETAVKNLPATKLQLTFLISYKPQLLP